MRTTLSPTPTQQWMSLGLSKWHQAIARREATRIASSINGLAIQWAIQNPHANDPSGNEISSILMPFDWRGLLSGITELPQVVLIDRKQADLAVEHDAKHGRELPNLMFASPSEWQVGRSKSAGPLFVLWDWGSSGKSSLEWATSLGFVGVIFDFSTLRSWVRVAVERLPTTLKELHPLVATLPHQNSVQPRK